MMGHPLDDDMTELNEWIHLMLTAKKLGVTPLEIRTFFAVTPAIDKFEEAPTGSLPKMTPHNP